MTEHDRDDDTWTQRIRSELDTSARDLDAATLSRLNQARQQALRSAAKPRPRLWLWPTTLATAFSLALAIAPQILGHDVDEHLAESWIEPTILCMQGLAIQETAQPDLDRRIRVLASITESARALVTAQTAIPVARDLQPARPRTPSNRQGSDT